MNETERVEAIATSGGAAPPNLEGDEPVEQREAALACSVEAELTGVDFEIQPSGPQATSFLDGDIVQWAWNVKPERSGSDLSLQLTVRGFVDEADRGSTEGELVRGPAPIIVDISVEAESKSVTERVADVWFGFWSSTVWRSRACSPSWRSSGSADLILVPSPAEGRACHLRLVHPRDGIRPRRAEA